MSSTPSHGGRRPGAGRPPLGDQPLVQIAIRLPPSTIALLDELAAKKNMSRNAIVRNQLQHFVQESQKKSSQGA